MMSDCQPRPIPAFAAAGSFLLSCGSRFRFLERLFYELPLRDDKHDAPLRGLLLQTVALGLAGKPRLNVTLDPNSASIWNRLQSVASDRYLIDETCTIDFQVRRILT